MKNNPFKMWGSWVGGYIIPLIVLLINSKFELWNNLFLYFWPVIAFDNIKAFLIFFVPGFLMGWSIHAFSRRKKK